MRRKLILAISVLAILIVLELVLIVNYFVNHFGNEIELARPIEIAYDTALPEQTAEGDANLLSLEDAAERSAGEGALSMGEGSPDWLDGGYPPPEGGEGSPDLIPPPDELGLGGDDIWSNDSGLDGDDGSWDSNPWDDGGYPPPPPDIDWGGGYPPPPDDGGDDWSWANPGGDPTYPEPTDPPATATPDPTLSLTQTLPAASPTAGPPQATATQPLPARTATRPAPAPTSTRATPNPEAALPTPTTASTPTVPAGSAPTKAPARPTATAGNPAPTATQAAAATAAPTATAAATAAATATPTATAEATATAAEPEFNGPVVSSLWSEQAPALDGKAGDPAWAGVPETVIETAGGANASATRVSVRSVYDGQRVYFLLTWADPSQSFLTRAWEKQPDGSWKRLASPDHRGDENAYHEDKISLLWPVNRSIPGFAEQGCGTACHAGENADAKPYGNMYTAENGQLADLWVWKPTRNVAQVDNLYLDHKRYSQDNTEAGRSADPSDGGGYYSNQTEDKKAPAFMPPDGGQKNGAPGFILESQKVELNSDLFESGQRVPGWIVAPFQGDRGQISAAWQYADGRWTLEISRALVTGSKYDVQFDDLSRLYFFGLATFDNTQIRHAFQNGAAALRFQQR